MPLVDGDFIEITMQGKWGTQTALNVWQYQITGTPAPVDAVSLGEAWWNHVKATYRALCISGGYGTFDSVLVREIDDPVGELAEFPVPSGERNGTRSATGLGDAGASFLAVGVRLSVGSRATRPGQKRIPYLMEADTQGNDVQAALLTLIDTHMDLMVGEMTLGAPAALTVIQPMIVRKGVGSTIVASQAVTGHVINPVTTSQVSRKVGRGD